MSMRDIQVLLSRQMNGLRPDNKPQPDAIKTANAQANLVGKYLSTVKLTIEYARLTGGKADLGFLKLSNGKAKEGQPAAAE